MKKITGLVAVLGCIILFTTGAVTTKADEPAATTDQQVAVLQQQIEAYRQQILALWPMIINSDDQDVQDQYVAQGSACAQQIVNLESQVKKITGKDSFYTIDLIGGSKAIIPTVVHTSAGDLVVAGLIPTDDINKYTSCEDYTVAVVLPDLRGTVRVLKSTIYNSNGSTYHDHMITFDETWTMCYYDESITENKVLNITAGN